MFCYAVPPIQSGLCVIVINILTSCDDIKLNENYVYNIKENWTNNEISYEEWQNPNILAYIDHRLNTVNKNSEMVAQVATGHLETTECMNITFLAHTKHEEIQATYTVSASQPEVNANKPGPPEQKVSSVTAKI
ncbi:hypothetical protein GN956_G26512, partial [Arapaima gigas]